MVRADYTELWQRANGAVSRLFGTRGWDVANRVWDRFLAWWDSKTAAWFQSHRAY